MKSSCTLLLVFFVTISNAQETGRDSTLSKKSNEREMIRSIPTFSIYGDNYFVTGADIRQTPTSETSDAKFQLGFKQMLTDVLLPYNTFLFVTYRQKSFWDIYKDSFPFRETNYNPGFGIAKLWFKDRELSHGLWFQFEHESNGRDGSDSRSWNFFSLRYSKPIGDHWQFIAKGWVPVGDISDNPDIMDYKGYFQVHAAYRPTRRLILEGEFSKSFTSDWRGNAQLSVSWRPFKKSNQFLYLQYYVGQAENLIEYQQSVSRLRIGVAFKELFGNFDGK